MQKAAPKLNGLNRLYQHEAGCPCWQCIEALNEWVRETHVMSIEQQAEALQAVIADYDLPHLLPVLKTLQWVRANKAKIKKIAPLPS